MTENIRNFHFPLKLVSGNQQTLAVVEEAALQALPFSIQESDVTDVNNYAQLEVLPSVTSYQWEYIALITISLSISKTKKLTAKNENITEDLIWFVLTSSSLDSSSQKDVLIPFALNKTGIDKLEQDANEALSKLRKGEYNIYILSETPCKHVKEGGSEHVQESHWRYSLLPFLEISSDSSVSKNIVTPVMNNNNVLSEKNSHEETLKIYSNNTTIKVEEDENEHCTESDINFEKIVFSNSASELVKVTLATIRSFLETTTFPERTHIFWPEMLTFPVNVNCDNAKSRIATHSGLLLPKQSLLHHNEQFTYDNAYTFRTTLRSYLQKKEHVCDEKCLLETLEKRFVPEKIHESAGAWERHLLCNPHQLLKRGPVITSEKSKNKSSIKTKSVKLFTQIENAEGETNNNNNNNNNNDEINIGNIAVVKGKYNYYHYKVDGFKDEGWGCAYRSLQTILSWFQYAGYINRPLPNITSIQKILSVIDSDKAQKREFVGSHEWIGSYEIMLVLQHYMPELECTIQHVESGAALDTDGALQYLLWSHFTSPEACPIMIGGSNYAHTIVGMYFDQVNATVQYLIVDPHYSSAVTNIKTIISKGYVGWKSAKTFFEASKWYNICVPRTNLYDPR